MQLNVLYPPELEIIWFDHLVIISLPAYLEKKNVSF